MKKVLFRISTDLLSEVDEIVAKWGFSSRAEFLRFAIIDFMRNESKFMPAADALKSHAKAINSVKAGKNLARMLKNH